MCVGFKLFTVLKILVPRIFKRLISIVTFPILLSNVVKSPSYRVHVLQSQYPFLCFFFFSYRFGKTEIPNEKTITEIRINKTITGTTYFKKKSCGKTFNLRHLTGY